jgi:hypothetical protein
VRVIEALERSIATGAAVSLDAPPLSLSRPALDQERRRPPVAKPRLVNVEAPH